MIASPRFIVAGRPSPMLFQLPEVALCLVLVLETGDGIVDVAHDG